MKQWQGKQVVVVGLGISNVPLIRYLQAHGAAISGRDRKTAAELGERYELLRELDVDLRLGADYLVDLDHYDAVFLTPGIPKHLPEIQALIGRVPLLSEVALVLKQAKAPVFGITGSSGKTTTTTLVGEMLKAANIECHVGGNIGTPLIERIEEIPADEPIVMELSSFQLELLEQSPHLALITNISENHLDVHLTMDKYIHAKKQIYLHQTPQDVVVLNFDDPIVAAMAEEAVGSVYYFSLRTKVNPGIYVDEADMLVFQDQAGIVPLISKQDIGLIGEHNVQNIMAAALAAHLAGADWDAIRTVARNFKGVKHRLEPVAVINEVSYVNDSIATSPARTIAGIEAFTNPVILIAGGYDKKLSYRGLAEAVVESVKAVILMGQTAGQIQREILAVEPEYGQIYRAHDLNHAVDIASQLAGSGDTVLLSPACASFDMYPNFEARGDHFRRIVQDLAAKMDESTKNGGMVSG